jgi:hypothetical protein
MRVWNARSSAASAVAASRREHGANQPVFEIAFADMRIAVEVILDPELVSGLRGRERDVHQCRLEVFLLLDLISLRELDEFLQRRRILTGMQ